MENTILVILILIVLGSIIIVILYCHCKKTINYSQKNLKKIKNHDACEEQNIQSDLEANTYIQNESKTGPMLYPNLKKLELEQ